MSLALHYSQPVWRTVRNFTAWNKDLPIKPPPCGLSVRPYGRTKKLQSDKCERAPPARGSAIQRGLEMSGCRQFRPSMLQRLTRTEAKCPVSAPPHFSAAIRLPP